MALLDTYYNYENKEAYSFILPSPQGKGEIGNTMTKNTMETAMINQILSMNVEYQYTNAAQLEEDMLNDAYQVVSMETLLSGTECYIDGTKVTYERNGKKVGTVDVNALYAKTETKVVETKAPVAPADPNKALREELVNEAVRDDRWIEEDGKDVCYLRGYKVVTHRSLSGKFYEVFEPGFLRPVSIGCVF